MSEGRKRFGEAGDLIAYRSDLGCRVGSGGQIAEQRVAHCDVALSNMLDRALRAN